MSVFQNPQPAPLPINTAIVGSTVATIVDATDNVFIVEWFEVNENAGGTQNLTVDIYDGTNARYLSDDGGTVWVAHAVTAYKGYKFTQGYVIPKGSKLRVTSSDASGKFNVHGLKVREA